VTQPILTKSRGEKRKVESEGVGSTTTPSARSREETQTDGSGGSQTSLGGGGSWYKAGTFNLSRGPERSDKILEKKKKK